MMFRKILEHTGKCFPFSFSVHFEIRNRLLLVYRKLLEYLERWLDRSLCIMILEPLATRMQHRGINGAGGHK